MWWGDAMLAEDPIVIVGRFLWWVENADLSKIPDSVMKDFKHAVGHLEEIEYFLEYEEEI